MKISHKAKKYMFNLILTTVFGGIIGLINYLFNIFLARFTTESIFGIYSTAIGIIYLIQIPALSIQNVLTKSVGGNKKGDLLKLKYKSVILTTCIGLLLGLLFFLIVPRVSDPITVSKSLIVPLSITLLLAIISPIPKGILLGQEKVLTVNIIFLLETVAKFGIGYLAIRMGSNIELLVLANAIPAFLGCIVTLPFIKSAKSYKKKIKISYKEIILMTITLLLLSAPYTFGFILTPEPLKAEYGALSLIGKIVYYASVTIAFVMFARLSNQKELKKQIKTLSTTILIAFGIGIFLTLFIFLFEDLVIELAFGGKYVDIKGFITIFNLLMCSYSIVFILANFFFTKSSYTFITILTFVTMLQFILFNFLNMSLFDIVLNQLVIFSSLLILSIIYFIYYFSIKDVKKET